MRWFLVLLTVGGFAGALFGALHGTQYGTQDGTQYAALWHRSSAPLPVVKAAPQAASSQQCAACHDEIVADFERAPHNITLRPGTDADIIQRLAGRQATFLDDQFQFELHGGKLRFGSSRLPESATIDWVFGSGNHALTPVTLTTDPEGKTAMIEALATWYAAGDVMDLTPGTQDPGAQVGMLGRYHGYDDTVGCFECHCSYLPQADGKIDFAEMHPGVSCVRCHLGSRPHVASGGDTPTRVDWSSLTAREAINRCGECHRRSDEFTPDELVPENSMLIRFAPVSISQSRCFQVATPNTADGQVRRLDCLTCHDPHKVTVQSPQFYVDKCLTCHDSQTPAAPDCKSQPMTSQCLECHMPNVATTKSLFFTDHWIRIRE